MTGPAAFEQMVARDYEARGYRTRVTGGTNDWGIDVFATKGDETLGIQAKMYLGARRVNRRQVFELFGAAAYFNCTGSVMATDGALDPDAADAAMRLGVAVVAYGSLWEAPSPAVPTARLTFDSIWERSVMPLAGKLLTRPNGTSNTVVTVDWGGITRRSSSGNSQKIDIEIFRWAIERVLECGSVTRDEINAQYEKRASSGIVLILAQVPEFDVGGRPLRVSLRGSQV